MTQPCVGDVVLLGSGEKLGVITRLAPLAIQVSTGDLLFWVQNAGIGRAASGEVALVCDAAGLHRYSGTAVPATAALRA
jgi:ABC-type cobalamin transport system ATPase subunit